MGPVVLILTNEADRLTPRVISELQGKGATCIRFDTERFPGTQHLAFTYNCDGTDRLVFDDGSATVDLSRVTAVWNRRPGKIALDPRLTPEDQEFASREARRALEALFYCLQDRFWVNPFDTSDAAEHKGYQLKVARAVGLDVPCTLITNDPTQVRDFHASCRNGMVYKTLTPQARLCAGRKHGVFTNRVSVSDIEQRLDQVQFAPCIFQEYVEKSVELRVTVIGERVFTCSLDSQSLTGTKDDWRKTVLYGRIPHRAADIPDLLKVQLLRTLRALGLVFGCFDFVLTPDGRHVFLEVNPNGQWYWIERETSMPMMDAFTDLLMQGRPVAAPATTV